MNTQTFRISLFASPARRFGALLLAGIAALGAASCAQDATGSTTPPLPEVTVAHSVARNITEWDEFTGRLEPEQSVAIRPRVSGLITQVSFEEGSLVRQGQTLFQIDGRPFQAQVDRLRAELAQATVARDRAAAETRRGDRLSSENAMTVEERERRAGAAAEAAAHVEAVAAMLRATELDLSFTKIVSPIAGRVSRALVTRGNLVSGGATLLTTVVSLDPIYASFDADERAFLRYGDQVRRQTDGKGSLPIDMALADEAAFPHQGALDFLDNQLDPSTGTIRGRAVFRNPDHRLTPGLFVRLRLPGTAAYRGVLVEDRAVGTDLGRRFVLVVGGDRKVESRTVTLGPLVDGLRVVRKGLEPGEMVVINGLQRVQPGVQVNATVASMQGETGGAR
jgi:multidrug efflux system membrane fusion protein